jgi:hypothetical protein
MENDNLSEKVKEVGFNNLDDFIKSNLHYLSENMQSLFYRIVEFPNYHEQ